MKKTAAAIPVNLERKFDEPLAPNKLPEAPEPNAAPISAPLPCWSKTKPIMSRADSTWIAIAIASKEFMFQLSDVLIKSV
jgi:hypothetical protein